MLLAYDSLTNNINTNNIINIITMNFFSIIIIGITSSPAGFPSARAPTAGRRRRGPPPAPPTPARRGPASPIYIYIYIYIYAYT